MADEVGKPTEAVEEANEDNATPEERMAWLRARGVTIEEPGEKQGPELSATGGRFTFVKIPADENQSCEECDGPLSLGDALPNLLAAKFAGCSLTDDELRVHAATAGQAIGISTLRTVMMQGRAESFRLAVPTDANGRVGVYAYLDEASSMKGLPINMRATALPANCGFPASCQFAGDVYIGRQKWSAAGLVENVDFSLEDLTPGALWMRRAVPENLELQKSLRPEEHEAAQASGADKPASGEADGYSWQDQGEELEILLQVPEGTGKKDVKVEFKRQEIRVLKPAPLSLKLFAAVEIDGCSWTMGGPGQVIITLEKDSKAAWPKLLA
mmetsp:Transcript_42155/g.68280  ORF Transcript_42155/g.68280 Transcript_42155/m.68280 type:complete len:328 (-) Transcript_42155:89-1072(-)